VESTDRFRSVLWRVVIGGFAAHGTFVVVFALLGLPGAAWETAVGSVMPSLAYALMRRDRTTAALAVMCLDIAAASALGTLFFGGASGFLFYLIVPLVLIGLRPGRSLARWPWVGLLGAVYVALAVVWPPMTGMAALPQSTAEALHVFNVLVVSAAVVLMAQLSARTVARARHAESAALKKTEGIALRDGLTGLLNRRAMEEALATENSRSRRSARPYCVVMADVDRFKGLDDRYGQAAGDAVVLAVGRLLRASVRDHDLVSRWGGEEFVLLLPETGLAGAMRVAETLRVALEALAIDIDGESLHVTSTFGVAEGDGECNPGRVVEAADAAMRRGKSEGRNRVLAAPPLPAAG